MSQVFQHESQAEVGDLFRDQFQLILDHKAVTINSYNVTGNALDIVFEKLALLILENCPSLEIEELNIIDSKISRLPAEANFLLGPSLRILKLNCNDLANLPDLSLCSNLESLDLTHNNIKIIHKTDLTPLSSLKYLLLKDNKLSFIPPSLLELTNLENVNLSGNPLIFPSAEYCDSLCSSIRDLKTFLLNNNLLLEQHIEVQTQLMAKQTPSTPSFARSRSVSDTRSKSLKASRRMGLFINSSKASPDGNLPVPADSVTPSKPERKLLLSVDVEQRVRLNEKFSNGQYDSSKSEIVQQQSQGPTSNFGMVSKVMDHQRTRSSKEEPSGDQGDSNDLSSKLNTFPRRLSTLQESLDETLRNRDVDQMRDFVDSAKPKPQFSRYGGLENSPTKSIKRSATFFTDQASFASNTSNQLPQNYPILLSVLKKFGQCLRDLQQLLTRLKLDQKGVTVFEYSMCSSEELDFLQDRIDKSDFNEEHAVLLVNLVQSNLGSFKAMIRIIKENLKNCTNKVDLSQLRAVYLSTFGTFYELNNIHRLTLGVSNSTQSQQLAGKLNAPNGSIYSDTKAKHLFHSQAKDHATEFRPQDTNAEDIDFKLLQAVDHATSDALIVLTGLTANISPLVALNNKSSQNLSPILFQKCKELKNVCISTTEVTRRLIAHLNTFRVQRTWSAKKLLWDEMNLFLKAVLQIFATVKGIMNDAPILNEVRQSMANLTKSTKEVTVLLEASSFKGSSEISGLSTNLSLLNGSSVSQLQLPNFPPTPSSLNLQMLASSKSASRPALVSNHGSSTGLLAIFQSENTRVNGLTGLGSTMVPSTDNNDFEFKSQL